MRDAAAIAAVHSASWRAAYADLLPQAYLDTLHPSRLTRLWSRRLRARSRGIDRRLQPVICVAVVEDRVLGFSEVGPARRRDLHGFSGEIFYLYVHPTAFRQGIGRALYWHGLALLEARRFLWVVVRVLQGNLPARRFYERMGLRLDGHVEADRSFDPPVRVVRFAGALNPVFDFEALGRRRGSS